jgi:SHS2 domain-containing protein
MNYPYENTTHGTIETLSKIEKRLKKEKQLMGEMNDKLFQLMEDIVKKKNTIHDMENHIEWKFELK